MLERRDGLDAIDVSRFGGHSCQVPWRRLGRTDDQAGRRLGEGTELGLDELIGGPGRAAGRQAARVGSGEGDVQERSGQHQQDEQGGEGPQGGSAHDHGGDPVPASCRLSTRGLAVPARRAARCDAVPVDRQKRRQDEQREDTSREDDDGTGDPHGVDEALGEDGERRHGGRDGERAEEHRPACGPPHDGQGGLGRALPVELLTESRDDQEAEVDREAQAEGDDQVEGEDRQRQGHHDQAHDTQRHGDGEHGADEGHRCRPDAPEDEEQQQDQERQGEELGPAQVLRGHRGDLDVGGGGSPEPDIALERRLRRDGRARGR